MTDIPILSVDELCKAAETTLKAALPAYLALPDVQAWLGDSASRYGEIKTWQQLPTIEALSAATFPAIAITSPGLTEPPRRVRSRNVYECTWRIGIGIYDRGRDHEDTQAKARKWAAIVRSVMLRNQTLGGVAERIDWAGEEYRPLRGRNEGRGQARTIGGSAVALDVQADVPIHGIIPAGLLPVAETTIPTLAVE